MNKLTSNNRTEDDYMELEEIGEQVERERNDPPSEGF